MKIKIINPNTTWTMTEDISVAGKKFARPDTEVYAVSPSTGPESIESMYDEYLAVPGVLSEIIKGDREEHADAFIIACFGDPGLLAAKEVTEKPVIGIAQAAFTVAKMIAPNFSVVYVLDLSLIHILISEVEWPRRSATCRGERERIVPSGCLTPLTRLVAKVCRRVWRCLLYTSRCV